MDTNLSKTNERPERNGRNLSQNRMTFAPRVDIFENGHEFLVVAEMPGADKESIQVSLEAGELTISARRPATEGNVLAGGAPVGEYYRVFSMPDTIDGDKVEAEFKGGILNVKLPKRAEVKARKISVRAS